MKKFELLPLPYVYDALQPVISKEIMTLHHDKHHAAYVNGANAALEKLEKFRKGEVWVFAEQHGGRLEDTPLELMSKARKLLSTILNNPKAVRFGDACKAAELLGFARHFAECLE